MSDVRLLVLGVRVGDRGVTGEVVFLVREERVPLERLRPGDRIILPTGRRVVFERLDEYDDGFVVRWWRPAERGEPGHRGGKNHVDAVHDEHDGRCLGSLMLMGAGETVRVDRG